MNTWVFMLLLLKQRIRRSCSTKVNVPYIAKIKPGTSLILNALFSTSSGRIKDIIFCRAAPDRGLSVSVSCWRTLVDTCQNPNAGTCRIQFSWRFYPKWHTISALNHKHTISVQQETFRFICFAFFIRQLQHKSETSEVNDKPIETLL